MRGAVARLLLVLLAPALTAVLAVVLTTAATAAPPTAAIVYDVGGKMDKGFLQLAYQGVQEVRRREAAALVEYEVPEPAARLEVVLAAAAQHTFVITVGAGIVPVVEQVAREQPNRRFVVIDGEADLPNVAAISFADHEAAFLAGAMAGLASRSGIAGFIGGVEVPPIRRFRAGFRQGFQFTRPQGRVLAAVLGTESAAWDDPFSGLLLARQQIEAGADVLFAAAGASGLGVYQAARDAGCLAIGVDANQNYLHPGTMLTSAVKRVDRAVMVAAAMLGRDAWKPGQTVLGLRDDGVGVAFDEHNAALTAAMRAEIEQLRHRITVGDLTVASE
ncbi:BMP family ABC transporter substrate-binding protein [Caenispirillum bisanense]|uniref:BMP family ABC transporter substrate-binding protein n=1 Tax=Caenispirillum bisanense TaxID=414052 RepID=UPI0031D1EA2C